MSQRFSLLERWHYMLLNAEGKLDFSRVHATEGRERSLNGLLAMCNPRSSTRMLKGLGGQTLRQGRSLTKAPAPIDIETPPHQSKPKTHLPGNAAESAE